MYFELSIEDGDQFTSFWMHNRWWGGFITIHCTFPGILRSFIAVAFRFGSCSGKKTIAIHEQIASNIGMHVGKEWKHEDFCVMENVSAIAKAGKAFGGNA